MFCNPRHWRLLCWRVRWVCLRPIFSIGANRVLGLRERGWVPPPPHGRFLQYTVATLEWKRLLQEAIVKDETFHVVYAHLPGSGGDEVWRATAWERRVSIHFEYGSISECTVESSLDGHISSCSEDTELPYQLQVPWWVQKLGLYHGILYCTMTMGHLDNPFTVLGPNDDVLDSFSLSQSSRATRGADEDDGQQLSKLPTCFGVT